MNRTSSLSGDSSSSVIVQRPAPGSSPSAMPMSGSTQPTSVPRRRSSPGCPARAMYTRSLLGGNTSVVTVAKTWGSERSATSISSRRPIFSSWFTPVSTAVRHATRRQTPRAASAAPWPDTSPITACTAPSAVCTTS